MRLFFINIVFLFLAITPVIAQNFNSYYNFKHLNVENGLADNIVYHFLQDSRGYMWLGTRNGITLYDGKRTINFEHNEQDKNSLSGNFITRILEDSDHLIWIGTNAGIDLFNRSNNSFSHFNLSTADNEPGNTNSVLLGFVNRTDLWFIDTKSKTIQIFNTKSKKNKVVIATDAVDGMLYANPVTHAIHIWTYLSIGSTQYVFQNNALVKQNHFFNKENNSIEPRLLVYHVYMQNDSTAWLSTAKGLIELNPVSRNYKIYDRSGTQPVTEIRYVTISQNGILWVSTGGQGIYTFDPKTKKFGDHFQNYVLDPFSICNNNIVSLYFDKAGNIWCGSYGNGVSYANVETKFFSKHLSKNEIEKWKKENNVFSLAAGADGDIWCILQDVRAIWQLDSSLKIKKIYDNLLEKGKPFLGSLYQIWFDSKYSCLLGTDRGLYRYNTVANTMSQLPYRRFSDGLFGSYWLRDMIRLHDSSFLFSTMSGLYGVKKEKGRDTVEPFSALNEKAYKDFDIIFEDARKYIYVKDMNNSLYILAPSATSNNYTVKKIISFSNDIIQFSEDSADVFIASIQGLFILHKNNFIIEKAPVNNSLPFTTINNVLVEKNKVWLFSEKGLYYFNAGEKSGRLFTVEDGLPSNKFNELCMLFTSEGKCLVGTNNGILAFYPDKLNDTIHPPRAQLISMYVNDSAKSFISNPQETPKIVLAHYQNTFSFDFSCISFQHVAECSYQYKLENYDENWISNETTHYTRYSKIPPGKYNFQLRVIDAKGNISPYTKSLSIEIQKAFWQTSIFNSIIAGLLVLLLWLLLKWFVSLKTRKQEREFEKQQAVEKERTRIATDMHDDLGAGLTSIKFLSEKVKRNSFSDVAKKDLDNILYSSSELIDKMNEIVWAMNEKNDSLEDMLVYIRSYAKEYCEANSMECEIEMPENIPSLFVSGDIRRNVFLTIKECLHNMVKHANAGRADIKFSLGPRLFAVLRDNGKGFNPDDSTKGSHGNGLKNMRKRIISIGGNFKIYNNKGTVIEIEIPLAL